MGTAWTRQVVSRRRVLAAAPLGVLASLLTVGCEERRGPRLFGLSASGLDVGALNQAESAAQTLGKALNILNVYEAFSWENPLPTDLLNACHAAGCTPEITWEPWDPDGGPVQPMFAPTEVAGGRYDSYITGWARQAAAYNGQILLRFAHEMNGNWYPWSVRAGGNRPEDYVAAYQRVRRIFDDAHATRVVWVWSPNVIINGDKDAITSSYPGDAFVNVIGVDGYNFGDVPGHRWTQPADLFAPTLDLLGALAPAKPVWINEVGCADRGGDKSRWITDFLSFLATTKVAALVWFEVRDDTQPDWRLTSTPQTTAAAKAALARW